MSKKINYTNKIKEINQQISNWNGKSANELFDLISKSDEMYSEAAEKGIDLQDVDFKFDFSNCPWHDKRSSMYQDGYLAIRDEQEDVLLISDKEIKVYKKDFFEALMTNLKSGKA